MAGPPQRMNKEGSPEARVGGSTSGVPSRLAGWEETAGGRPLGPFILSPSLSHKLMSLRMPWVLASRARGPPQNRQDAWSLLPWPQLLSL